MPLYLEMFSFYTFRMPAAGKLGHVYPHTHAVLCRELLLFASSPKLLGLSNVEDSDASSLARQGFIDVARSGDTIIAIRNRLVAKAEPVCHFVPWQSAEPQNLDGIAHSAECSKWIFEKDDSATTLGSSD